MPELPEVETIVREISPLIETRTILKAQVFNSKLRIEIPKTLIKQVKNQKIIKVSRKAKYILIELEQGEFLRHSAKQSFASDVDTKKVGTMQSMCSVSKDKNILSDKIFIIIHLGMSGRLRVYPKTENYKRAQHDHVVIHLDDGSLLVFNDTRRFGLVTLLREDQFADFKFFKKLGLEPLAKEFNTVQLFQLVQKRNKSIKSVIMDASIIVGVGNIYASESLFSSGIHPRRIASTLTKKEAGKLHKAIVETLQRAIAAGGSTLRDYTKADGKAGYFQHQFLVYDRLDKPCTKCSRPIQQIRQNGRSSYYCSYCQS